ncbi:hypothetical protein G4B88_024820 [Cannabis sativa]|uniref:Uncharacterized protein n=1 Tax=Cannabis sativa TaxID=3483 RepID=A0A7J6E163_CANSA|nr:hypothetical protein G4B88_024820 [Cannabis sativa]
MSADLLTNNNGKKNGRGPTQMRDIWGNHDVRDGKNAPINYKSWHKVPDKYKDRMWKLVQIANACFKTSRKILIFFLWQKIGLCGLVEQKKYKDKRVYAGQWEELIKYWTTDDAKKISATNKASRGQKKYNHTTGTKSFAQIRAAQKENGGSTPTRVAMFNVQLQEKQELNEDVSKEKGMNDTFSEVMGKEKYGSFRMYGFGVCPSDVWENKSTKKGNQKKYIQTLEAELKELRSQVQANKQNYNANDTSIIPDMDKQNYPNNLCPKPKEIPHTVVFSLGYPLDYTPPNTPLPPDNTEEYSHHPPTLEYHQPPLTGDYSQTPNKVTSQCAWLADHPPPHVAPGMHGQTAHRPPYPYANTESSIDNFSFVVAHA